MPRKPRDEVCKFIRKLGELQEGERSRLRQLAGQPLDETLPGFDLFTGLWWPLRNESQAAPRRETSWLVAKLFGAFPIPNMENARTLPCALGKCEPPLNERTKEAHKRFRDRFDALLCADLSSIEPHLRWALGVLVAEMKANRLSGLDWAQLLDDISAWDRADQHGQHVDIREKWAREYLGPKDKGETTEC